MSKYVDIIKTRKRVMMGVWVDGEYKKRRHHVRYFKDRRVAIVGRIRNNKLYTRGGTVLLVI